MTQKIKHRDNKLDKRRNLKGQNSFHKDKNRAKKIKKKYQIPLKYSLIRIEVNFQVQKALKLH